jgi:hypothetical protein
VLVDDGFKEELGQFQLVDISFRHSNLIAIFVSRFTITRILVQPNLINSGKSVTKSIVMPSHGGGGISQGMLMPCLARRGALIRWHSVQALTHLRTCKSNAGQYKSLHTSCVVLRAPKCPDSWLSWNRLITFPRRELPEGTYILPS